MMSRTYEFRRRVETVSPPRARSTEESKLRDAALRELVEDVEVARARGLLFLVRQYDKFLSTCLIEPFKLSFLIPKLSLRNEFSSYY